MDRVVLEIESGYESQKVEVDDEVSIGRTSLATVVLPDRGLSKVNTTFFRDGRDVLVVDEGSSNGTFLNGSRLGREPRVLFDGDEIRMGLETSVRVKIGDLPARSPKPAAEKQSDAPKPAHKPAPVPSSKPASGPDTRLLIFLALGSTFLIVAAAALVIVLVDDSGGGTGGSASSRLDPNALIPIAVQDPFGGQKQEDIDELVQYFEVQDEINVDDLQDVTGSDSSGPDAENFNVTVEYFKSQQAKAMEARNAPVGNDPPGQVIPKELRGDGVIKQKAKLREMVASGYQQPMDYADLAAKRMSGELVELPMATEYWVLEVGSNASDGEFTSFDFDTDVKSPVIAQTSQDFSTLAQLATNFSGKKYDMFVPTDRKQMKHRLLRMFHPTARPILRRIAEAYYQRFNRPLRVTSLSRSMEYQISLNKTNANSFKVRGKGSLPPHTSGCAFDLARKHMTAEEQNFLMAELAKMENEGILDALREGNANACFHVFIYPDGIPPRM